MRPALLYHRGSNSVGILLQEFLMHYKGKIVLAGLQEIFFVFKFKVKNTPIDFKPIGSGLNCNNDKIT
jgi:hypothetical protein